MPPPLSIILCFPPFFALYFFLLNFCFFPAPHPHTGARGIESLAIYEEF